MKPTKDGLKALALGTDSMVGAPPDQCCLPAASLVHYVCMTEREEGT